MTYILGINDFGENAIICDTRVTWWRSDKKAGGANISLKCGMLFSGCLYAITGDIDEAGKFIRAFKAKIDGTWNNLQGLWSDFIKFEESYFSKAINKASFSLLLSSRCQGEPKFFILDSQNGVRLVDDSLVTLGSGKEILDTTVQKWFENRRSYIREIIKDNGLPEFTFPYFYCLWLNEIAQGEQLSILERYNVGGIFHFKYQDLKNDYSQLPAVYVLSAADEDNKLVHVWIYRVSCVQDCLVVDNPIMDAREFLFSSIARPSRLKDNYLNNWNNVVKEIDNQANSLPFYYFCGFGFPQMKHRGPFGCHVTSKNDCVITKGGYIAKEFKALIVDSLRKDYGLVLENNSLL